MKKKEVQDKYIQKLKKLRKEVKKRMKEEDDDQGADVLVNAYAHQEADALLLAALDEMGLSDLAKAYRKIEKEVGRFMYV